MAQIGSIHLQKNDPTKAVVALSRAVELLESLNQSSFLTFAHLDLVEAYLQLGDVANAILVLQEPALPEPPMDALLRDAITELESRFEVSLHDE